MCSRRRLSPLDAVRISGTNTRVSKGSFQDGCRAAQPAPHVSLTSGNPRAHSDNQSGRTRVAAGASKARRPRLVPTSGTRPRCSRQLGRRHRASHSSRKGSAPGPTGRRADARVANAGGRARLRAAHQREELVVSRPVHDVSVDRVRTRAHRIPQLLGLTPGGRSGWPRAGLGMGRRPACRALPAMNPGRRNVRPMRWSRLDRTVSRAPPRACVCRRGSVPGLHVCRAPIPSRAGAS